MKQRSTYLDDIKDNSLLGACTRLHNASLLWAMCLGAISTVVRQVPSKEVVTKGTEDFSFQSFLEKLYVNFWLSRLNNRSRERESLFIRVFLLPRISAYDHSYIIISVIFLV